MGSYAGGHFEVTHSNHKATTHNSNIWAAFLAHNHLKKSATISCKVMLITPNLHFNYFTSWSLDLYLEVLGKVIYFCMFSVQGMRLGIWTYLNGCFQVVITLDLKSLALWPKYRYLIISPSLKIILPGDWYEIPSVSYNQWVQQYDCCFIN